MIKQTSWCTYKDVKLEKVDKKYLKNVRMKKDEDGLIREVGEIDFLKIPQNELIKVFKSMKELRLEHNYDKKNVKFDDEYYDITPDMWDYLYAIRKHFNMNEKELFKLLRDYLTKNTDQEKYKNFASVLDATCKLRYRDYDDYEYSDYDEHPHPSQEDIDHNYVGDYELIVMQPIPLKVIQAIRERVKVLTLANNDKEIASFDDKHTLPELNNFEDKL